MYAIAARNHGRNRNIIGSGQCTGKKGVSVDDLAEGAFEPDVLPAHVCTGYETPHTFLDELVPYDIPGSVEHKLADLCCHRHGRRLDVLDLDPKGAAAADYSVRVGVVGASVDPQRGGQRPASSCERYVQRYQASKRERMMGGERSDCRSVFHTGMVVSHVIENRNDTRGVLHQIKMGGLT